MRGRGGRSSLLPGVVPYPHSLRSLTAILIAIAVAVAMPSYLHPASMHCAPHAQDRGANVPAHPNSRELAAPTHIYFCTESQSCIPPQSRAYHLDSLPYTRSRDPRSMTTSELPAYTKAWEERERRGSVDSMRSDTSEDGPREPGSSSVPWLAYQPPQHAADEPLKSAPAYDGWYRDVVERLAAGGSLDAPEFAAILAKEVDATHALVPVGERN